MAGFVSEAKWWHITDEDDLNRANAELDMTFDKETGRAKPKERI